jgi:hypothetical protein
MLNPPPTHPHKQKVTTPINKYWRIPTHYPRIRKKLLGQIISNSHALINNLSHTITLALGKKLLGQIISNLHVLINNLSQNTHTQNNLVTFCKHPPNQPLAHFWSSVFSLVAFSSVLSLGTQWIDLHSIHWVTRSFATVLLVMQDRLQERSYSETLPCTDTLGKKHKCSILVVSLFQDTICTEN